MSRSQAQAALLSALSPPSSAGGSGASLASPLAGDGSAHSPSSSSDLSGFDATPYVELVRKRVPPPAVLGRMQREGCLNEAAVDAVATAAACPQMREDYRSMYASPPPPRATQAAGAKTGGGGGSGGTHRPSLSTGSAASASAGGRSGAGGTGTGSSGSSGSGGVPSSTGSSLMDAFKSRMATRRAAVRPDTDSDSD